MPLLAFDVDGTLDTSSGPVKVERLLHLHEIWGWRIVIVSPSSAYPKRSEPIDGNDSLFPRFVAGPNRTDNLMAARAAYATEGIYLYVSDNGGDDVTALAAGYTYIHPKDFR
jgi:hypothetical protein